MGPASGTAVEHSTHNPKIEGLTPSTGTGNASENGTMEQNGENGKMGKMEKKENGEYGEYLEYGENGENGEYGKKW